MRVLEARRQDIGADHVQSIGLFESGISSVAAPVLDMSGEVVAAVSATNVTDVVGSKVVEAVRKAATAMSMGLGWRGE
jgi:DNA-binding IclR family transcriptional regulator